MLGLHAAGLGQKSCHVSCVQCTFFNIEVDVFAYAVKVDGVLFVYAPIFRLTFDVQRRISRRDFRI